MTMISNNVNATNGQFGDTTMTKVFVGGLAWETPKETMRDHFAKFGEILEAVIIFDKVTGRSKGYGFVTFKEPEAAKKACEDPTPMINGRRANCNLAVLGARKPRQSSTPPPQPPPQPTGFNGCAKLNPTPPPAPLNHLHWYYSAGAPQAVASPLHHGHHQPLPYYGFRYSPAYIAADVSYNQQTMQKVSYNGGGAYMNGHYIHQVYTGNGGVGGGQPAAAMNMNMNVNMVAAVAAAGGGGNTMMPIYPLYQYHHHHQPHALAAAAAVFPTPGMATSPPIISKPNPVSLPPSAGLTRSTVCLAVE
ncbi:hypothetical protein Droror1_Dr00016877 [Drosera rotundifolia]